MYIYIYIYINTNTYYIYIANVRYPAKNKEKSVDSVDIPIEKILKSQYLTINFPDPSTCLTAWYSVHDICFKNPYESFINHCIRICIIVFEAMDYPMNSKNSYKVPISPVGFHQKVLSMCINSCILWYKTYNRMIWISNPIYIYTYII